MYLESQGGIESAPLRMLMVYFRLGSGWRNNCRGLRWSRTKEKGAQGRFPERCVTKLFGMPVEISHWDISNIQLFLISGTPARANEYYRRVE